MNVIDIYERVTLTTALSQPRFVHYFNDTVAYLISKYRPRYVLHSKDGSSFSPVSSVNDTTDVRDEYADCIIDNIIFLETGNVDRRTDFIAKSEYTYDSVWNDAVRGATLTNRCRWTPRW